MKGQDYDVPTKSGYVNGKSINASGLKEITGFGIKNAEPSASNRSNKGRLNKAPRITTV
jgi:hypothetical protein